jgi:hypothetical protein
MQRHIEPLSIGINTPLIALLGDVIDGLESYQAAHADPFIEGQLADLRYVHARLVTLTEPFRAASAR